MNNQKQDVKEIPYTGDFEDSDLDTESEESSQQSDSEEEQQQVQKKKKKKVFNPTKKLLMNVSDTQYPVVKFVGKMIYKFKLQYTPYLESNNWDFCWTDNAVMPETLSKMQIHQRINHFPGMYALARKNHLGRNLNKMQKQFQNEYDFYPRTWLLPSEYGDFKAQFQKGKAKTFIVKPEASCQGRGIFLTRNIDSINPQEHYVAQRYLHKPLLIDGLKFDFRLYVLLAGCDPLRIYIYKEGLARFATSPYQPPHSQNLDEITMHLTNYAINKDSPNFVFNDDDKKMDIGHKRSLESVYETLRQLNFDVDKLKEEIKDLIIKTFCAVQPILQQNYTQIENFHNNMCFEILGFDILIESSGKPYLLEVNHTPSFTTDTPLDSYIKKNLIRDTIKLMNINLKTKNEVQQLKKDQMQKRVLTGKKTKLTQEEKKQFKLQAQQERDEYEAQHQGDFEKIYPCEKSYDEFIAYAQKLYEEWTGANIRRNPKKEQIEQQQQQQQLLKQQQQQQNQQQKPQQKTSLYKHVQSKINTNLFPKQDQQQSKNDLFQDGSETAPQQYKDDNVVGEDHQHQHQFITPLDSTKELLEKNKNAFQEVQLVDLINYKRISMQQYVHEPLSTLQQQNSLSCLSPVVALNKQQFNYIQSQQAQQQKKNFSIRKPTKPKLERKLINYESDQELDRIKQIDNSKKEQIHLNTNNNIIQNGSFIKPKVFSLKIHHPPKGYKLQSLPILMQQNQTKFRYDS